MTQGSRENTKGKERGRERGRERERESEENDVRVRLATGEDANSLKQITYARA